MEFEKPECSKWKIWEGVEIEGTTDLGEKTLFVRANDPRPYWDNYNRVWFCKEFIDYSTILEAHDLGKKVCYEVTLQRLPFIPQEVLDKVQVYLKIEANLKIGDHICIGTAFKDQAFMIGEGAKVEPHQYAEDKLIE